MQIVTAILKLLSHLPFWALYAKSDVLAWLLSKAFAYRRSVVLQNLQRSFPALDEAMIQQIARDYYHHLADVIVETIKLSSMTKEQLCARIQFDDPGFFQGLADQGKNVVVMMGHSGNWEWAGCLTSACYSTPVLPVYRKVKNEAFDRYFKEIRSRFGAQPIVDKEAFEHISRAPKPHIVAMIADQTPSGAKGLWSTFLNQDTPFFRGTEVLIKRLDHVVVFAQVRKVKRGHYRIHLEKADMSDAREGVITLQFAAFMEREIRNQPFNWLWSHKRWKHQPKADARRIGN
jgi:KDO2-lipid IV(A) lauroyltransferase